MLSKGHLPDCARPSVLEPKDMRSSEGAFGVHSMQGCMFSILVPEWLQFVILSQIFNEILAFDLNIQKQIKSNQ